MTLKKGLAVHNELPDGYHALTINSGTVFHTHQPMEMVNFNGYSYQPVYKDDAYAAKRDWRPLTPQEIQCLKAGRERRDFDTIFLGEIPEQLQHRFKEMEITGCKSRQEVMECLRENPERTKTLNEALTAYLTPLAGNKPFHFHCLGINFPNIEMSACDTTGLPANYHPKDVRYMGMHNDGTQEMTLYTAHKFGNRININLGQEARAFLFVNLSMIQAANLLKKEAGLPAAAINIANIPQLFFKHFPDYPVIRVKQKPYQYYIAPTDNCFHDGSSLGNTMLDISFVYFGSFTC
ncbi:MAG: hypothetical protein JNM68_15320 [Dinghuibacter sp.]|nr:hypothetical protein [Dinghuibacter sp.]